MLENSKEHSQEEEQGMDVFIRTNTTALDTKESVA